MLLFFRVIVLYTHANDRFWFVFVFCWFERVGGDFDPPQLLALVVYASQQASEKQVLSDRNPAICPVLCGGTKCGRCGSGHFSSSSIFSDHRLQNGKTSHMSENAAVVRTGRCAPNVRHQGAILYWKDFSIRLIGRQDLCSESVSSQEKICTGARRRQHIVVHSSH